MDHVSRLTAGEWCEDYDGFLDALAKFGKNPKDQVERVKAASPKAKAVAVSILLIAAPGSKTAFKFYMEGLAKGRAGG